MKYIRTARTVNPETTIVFCQGEMDTVAVEDLHQAVAPLVEDATLHLVLELREVDYVSSSILQFLIETQDRLKKKGGRTSLVGAGPLVRSVIETARLDSLFKFHETLEERQHRRRNFGRQRQSSSGKSGPPRSWRPSPPRSSERPTARRPWGCSLAVMQGMDGLVDTDVPPGPGGWAGCLKEL